MHYMFCNKDKKVLILCHNKLLKRDIFNDIYTGFCNLHLHSYICTEQPNIGELDLTNGSSLRVETYNTEAIKGWVMDMIIVNEAEKWNKDDLEDILVSFYPIIKESGGKIIGLGKD